MCFLLLQYFYNKYLNNYLSACLLIVTHVFLRASIIYASYLEVIVNIVKAPICLKTTAKG
jgi:hypothetical protein